MDPQQITSRLRALTSSFSTGQLVTLAGAFVLVVGVVAGSAFWLNAPSYALLFADMDPESAGQIVTELKNRNVPFKLDEGGRGIRVPDDRVDELRLELSAQNLPASGRIGFEIFDRTQFGATQFLEQVNYRRALEGEIARTIATIGEVSNARVHIAMGKDSLFGDPRPAKASVVLKLRGSRPPSAATINGIGNLVASSVEGLRPEAVVILDSFGRPLARPEGDEHDPLGTAQMERQKRLETEMAARVVALLEPVVGPDRVRVNVAMKLDPTSSEETEERWDPNTVVRSKQTTADQSMGAASAAIAGARGNMPEPPPDANQPARGTQQASLTGPSSSRSAETTNFEVSRTTRHSIQPPGDLARLSVAVILDDDQVAKAQEDGSTTLMRKPRTREELQKIQGLVAAAVGLEPDRGDRLTVENVSFDEPVVEQGPPPSILQMYSPQIWDASRIAVVGLLGIIALMVFVRPLMRKAGVQGGGKAAQAALAAAAPALAMPSAGPKTVAELESEIDEELNAITAQYAESRRLPVLTRRVSAVTVNEPESVAKLLRSWIADSER
jgi:flagellar M-ring protein FliF